MKKFFGCLLILLITLIFCYADNTYAKELDLFEQDTIEQGIVDDSNNDNALLNTEKEFITENNTLGPTLNDKEEVLIEEQTCPLIEEEQTTIENQQDNEKIEQVTTDEPTTVLNEEEQITLGKSETDLNEEISNTLGEPETVLNEGEQPINNEPTSTENSSTNTNGEPSALSETGNTLAEAVYQTQKVKVIIKKVNEEGALLAGAKLQLIDSTGNIIEEWVSDGTEKVIFLTDGTYVLHEVEVPEGYDLAEDKEFIVKIELSDITAGVDFSSNPCPHYGGTPLYYVDIEGKKQEVYCINQNWEIPDENSSYDGEILDSTHIRDFTQQTVAVDAANNKEKIDISDQELTEQQLYDKILDIIYHRHKAESIFTDLSMAEIRFLTEAALKNYTNAGLTEAVIAYRKASNTTYVPLDADGVLYDERSNGDIFYLRHQYKDFVYNPAAELGKNIYEINFGQGNSFGQMVAYHWSAGHNAKTSVEERNKIARYYELYQYLINDDDHHPEDLNIYIYSTQSVYSGANPNSDYAYQNLLGIVGYFNEIEQQQQEVVMVNKYSTEVRNIPVVKIWKDNENAEKARPESITVNLMADGEIKDTVVLSEENNWQYTFENLDVYQKGNKIAYTISEVEVPRYALEIEGNMETGFTIINTYNNVVENPRTLDNITLYVLMLSVSAIGLIEIYFNKQLRIKCKKIKIYLGR